MLLAASGLAAVATLILWYGFPDPPVSKSLLGIAQTIIVGVFVLDRVMRLLLAPNRLRYLRENWVDFTLVVLAGAAVAISFRVHLEVLSAGALYVFITQAYILITLILRGVSVNLHLAGSGIDPAWLLIGSFLFLIFAGSGLLMLPAATPPEATIHYEEALFTATSATCVTGLVVRNTGTDFSAFGQAVILLLIQLGGLGIMMFGTVLAMLVGKGLSVRGSSTIGKMLSTEGIGNLGKVAMFVVTVTLVMEIIGTVLFYPMFAGIHQAPGADGAAAKAIWYSVFHSISSFCNAGFSLYDNNMMEGVAPYATGSSWTTPLREHWQIMGVMAPLIVLGGIGFPVLQDCARYLKRLAGLLWRRVNPASSRSLSRPRLTLHSKIVLTTSVSLIVLGAVVLLLVEPRASGTRRQGTFFAANWGDAERRMTDWEQMSEPVRIRTAVFQSITARTAGFNTISMSELSNASKLSMCGLMIVGGSPAGTAGGMKTVTLALLVLAMYSVLRRREDVEVSKRSISSELVRRAVAIAVLYLALLGAVTVLLCVALPSLPFMDVFFEACSACGTVGLSTGTTRVLNSFGKYVVIVGMFVGRLGPLTMLLAITNKMRHVAYEYPAENVVIG